MQGVQDAIMNVVGDWMKASPGTLSLGQGLAYYGPPQEVEVALKAFFQDSTGHTYKPGHGIPDLLAAIRQKLALENRLSLQEQTVVVTAGSNMAFSHVIFAITDPGDEVIILKPYYFNHEMAITIAGAKPVCVDTDAHYVPILSNIEAAITPQTRAVVTISPNNPTGMVYPEACLREINQLCRERGLYHIHDEAYEHFVYEGARVFSPGSIQDSQDYTISLYSLSKSYGFAGWRIGYMVIPQALTVAVEKIQDTQLICPTVAAQYAAIGALKAGPQFVCAKREQIETNRKIFLKTLNPLEEKGLRISPSQGAFYLFLALPTHLPALQICEELIRTYQVAVIPGETFGVGEEGCYLRVAYGALSEEQAIEGSQRLLRGLEALVFSAS